MEKISQNYEEGNQDDISRRDFLKKLGVVAGGLVAGGVIGEGLNKFEEAEGKYSKELISTGTIINKQFFPSNKAMIGGEMYMDSPEVWTVTVEVNGKQGKMNVSKEEFDSYNKGDLAVINFDDLGIEN